MNQKIHITLMKDHEREEVIAFIENHMMKSYGTKPSANMTPPDMLIARKESVIIGTLGMTFGPENLFFEELYDFDRQNLPINYLSEKCVYYTRWTGTETIIGLHLALAGYYYAQKKGFEFGACIVKPRIFKYIELKMKKLWHPITDAQIKWDMVPDRDLGYFSNGDMPIPCLGNIEEQICLLENNLKPININSSVI